MDINIRPEAPADYARVHEITNLAYESESEADLVDKLRREASPVISLGSSLGRLSTVTPRRLPGIQGL